MKKRNYPSAMPLCPEERADIRKRPSAMPLCPGERADIRKRLLSIPLYFPKRAICLGAAILAAAAVFAMPGIHAKAAEREKDGLVLVEGGTFTMGSPKKSGCAGKTKPHTV